MIPKTDYKRRYNTLISKAKKRDLKIFHEKHHIIPKCMGGSNDPSNIVKLTSKEHYWAHYLLAKMYPENSKLAYAFYMMCTDKQDYRTEVSDKLLASAKRIFKNNESTYRSNIKTKNKTTRSYKSNRNRIR